MGKDAIVQSATLEQDKCLRPELWGERHLKPANQACTKLMRKAKSSTVQIRLGVYNGI